MTKPKSVREILDNIFLPCVNNECKQEGNCAKCKQNSIDQALKELAEVVSENEIALILLQNGWNWDGLNRFKAAKAVKSLVEARWEGEG